MSTALLQIKNLAIDFRSGDAIVNAVKTSSFTIEKGEIVAIVGESGSGKSVTALSLLQLLSGTASIKGELIFTVKNPSIDLLKLSAKEISQVRGKDIAMIFQEPMTSLNPVFTCGDQVAEALQCHLQLSKAAAREKTIGLFEKVKLPEPVKIFDRYPHELSGGQKQRVMIAMAISCNPALLIADEPTTALDVTVQKTILSLIKELQEESGMSVVLISHDLGLVADITDKIIVMYRGAIVEQGITMDVLKNPQHPYTKALLACRPAMHPKGERLPVVSDFYDGEDAVVNRESSIVNRQPVIGSVKEEDNLSTINDQRSTILNVENLQVQFPGRKKLFGKSNDPFKAVDDVSFKIFKGETVGLVGESGCGKTTLGRAILQLVKITAGRIILNGTDLAAVSNDNMRELRKDLQIIFQDPYGSLNPRLTIGNAIEEPMKVHGLFDSGKQRRDKVMELLEKVDLRTEHFNRYPHQFSGGQRQRICIARALALNPSFLIFDESVSALDVSVQAQVLNLLNELKASFGFTSIFISHDLSVVRYISDRIMVMHSGRIVEEGPADSIYFSPQNPYTQKLVEAIPGRQLNKR